MTDPVIVFRNNIGSYTGKGSKLTSTEIDTNFYDLLLAVIALQSGGAFGVDTVEFSGNSITFHWTDSTSSGPFALPVATFAAKGVWNNSMPLARLDIFTVPGVGTYLVQFDHTTPAFPAPFDPAAENDSGELLYLGIAEAVDTTLFLTWKGEWAADTQYDENDVFTASGWGLFRANVLRTSDSSFDPYVEDDSVPAYTQLAGPPFSVVGEISTSEYEVSVSDIGRYLRVTTGCIIRFPQIPELVGGEEVTFRQAGMDSMVFFPTDELVVTLNPPRVGFASSTNWQGATVTAKYLGGDAWDLIGPFGDEAS